MKLKSIKLLRKFRGETCRLSLWEYELDIILDTLRKCPQNIWMYHCLKNRIVSSNLDIAVIKQIVLKNE